MEFRRVLFRSRLRRRPGAVVRERSDAVHRYAQACDRLSGAADGTFVFCTRVARSRTISLPLPQIGPPMFRSVFVANVFVAAVAAEQAAEPADSSSGKAIATDLPSGTYTLDPSHASLIFRVNHLGFSHFTSQFRRFDATLTLDPKHPESARVVATIDPRSIEIVDSKLSVDIQGHNGSTVRNSRR